MAKRRANGEGSLRKRKDGRWEGRYTHATNKVQEQAAATMGNLLKQAL